MKVFAISPINYSFLIYWFAVEAVFILLGIIIFAVTCITIYQWRLNFHLKVLSMFIISQCFPFMVARVFILGYQAGFYLEGEQPASSLLVIISSWWRGYYLLLILTNSTWVAIEREISLYYIYDYEHEQRWWVPISIISLAVIICSLGTTCYTFEWLTIFPLAVILVALALVGMALYGNNYKRTMVLNEALKNRKPCKLKYCLSVRYQLEENVWFSTMLKNAMFTLCLVNFFTVAAFISIYLPYFEEETHQWMDCLFNILIAANGPIVAFGAYFHNTYMVGLLKKFFGRKSVKPIDDEGDFYFGQLVHQWDEHYDH